MTEPAPVRPTLAEIHAMNAISDEVSHTDTSNAKLFVRLFHDIVRYSPELDQWYIWTETHWAPDIYDDIFELTEHVIRELRRIALSLPDEGDNSPRQLMLRFAAKTESEAARRRIVSMARSHPRIRIGQDELNEPDNTVTCPNGVVDLNTGELKPHDPRRLATACTAVEYDPDATSDLLDEWYETFMPDPTDQRTLWAVLGRALRSGNDVRALPLFLGMSTSGKSQLVGTVGRILRGYATTINASVFRGNLDDRPRPDLVRAVRSRIAFAHEAAQTWDMHGDHVKKLTGMDTIPVRNLFKEIVEIRPTFTPIIVANDMPHIKGADEALRRRIIVVKFARPLDESLVDPGKRKIFEEDVATQKAILAKIIAGARDTVKLADMSLMNVQALAEAFDEVDHIGSFLHWAYEQNVLVKAEEGVAAMQCAKASDLHAAYVFWVRKHGDRSDRDAQMNMRAFGKSLRARGWETTMAAGTRWLGWRLTGSMPWL